MQSIIFSPISDQPVNKKGIRLSAVSDAKVPVGFYVLEGPVAIEKQRLYFKKIPPKSKFPVKVTVVAWQYGSLNNPKLQTAIPVQHSFWIIK